MLSYRPDYGEDYLRIKGCLLEDSREMLMEILVGSFVHFLFRTCCIRKLMRNTTISDRTRINENAQTHVLVEC